MKRHLFVIISVVMAGMLLVSCDSRKGLHVTGEFGGAFLEEADTLIVMDVAGVEGHHFDAVDTVVVKDGRFEYLFETDSIAMMALFSSDYLHNRGRVALSLLAIPGEEVHLKLSDADGWELTGSSFYEEWGSVLRWLAQEESIDEMVSDSYVYITNNPDKESSAVLLTEILVAYDASSAIMAEPLLREDVRHGRLESWIDRAMLAAEDVAGEPAEFFDAGDEAPEFGLPDMEGKEVKLSDYRGKYVVLDFWGAWCKWCIKGFPDMKKYYAEYGNRVEIIGIDCGDTPEDWMAAVREHALPWVQVRMDDELEVLQLYGVDGFPTKVLIDPEGKIVKVIVGEDPAFYELLDELLAD